jgi:GTPase SAR1 family protein
LETIRNYLPPEIPVLLVGNKRDLEAERVVSFNQGQELADELNLNFLETSAKENDNVSEAFHLLATLVVARKI